MANSKKKILIAIVSVIVPLVFPDLVGQYFDIRKGSHIAVAIVIFLFCFAIITRVMWFFLTRIFDFQFTSIARLKYILAGYLYVIVSFAGIFLLLSFVYDLFDASNKYFYYNSISVHDTVEAKDCMIENNLRINNENAFQGIGGRLWSSVDSWELPENQSVLFLTNITGQVPLKNILETAKLPRSRVIYYLDGNKWKVYADCLYLSTVTVATVGYGDISPKTSFARMFVAIEVLIGQLLLIIGLGTVFSDPFKGNHIHMRMREPESIISSRPEVTRLNRNTDN
jgi:hypothetical protein